MQDHILDSESPISVHESDENKSDSDDEALPASTENLNFNLEFGLLEDEFKCSKYWPTFVRQEGKVLMGMNDKSKKEFLLDQQPSVERICHQAKTCLTTLQPARKDTSHKLSRYLPTVYIFYSLYV